MKITPTLTNLILFFYLQIAITEVIGQKCKAEDREPWSYEGRSNGPKRWKKTFRMCGGRSQSPIDIDTDAVEASSDLDQLQLMGYDRALTRAVIENNGHTVEVTPRDRIRRYIEIEDKQFSLRQFHFHWSEDQNEGSEHALDGTRYGMEAHFVHTSEDNETAVVGVLYEVTSDRNDALQQIVKVLPKIRYKDQRTNFKGNIKLEDFFPENPASFYRYQGSLTTPPCTEGVTWSVVKTVLQSGEDQLSEFLKLYAVPKNEAGPGCRITTNVRPLQKVNGRTVYESA